MLMLRMTYVGNVIYCLYLVGFLGLGFWVYGFWWGVDFYVEFITGHSKWGLLIY